MVGGDLALVVGGVSRGGVERGGEDGRECVRAVGVDDDDLFESLAVSRGPTVAVR